MEDRTRSRADSRPKLAIFRRTGGFRTLGSGWIVTPLTGPQSTTVSPRRSDAAAGLPSRASIVPDRCQHEQSVSAW